MAAVVLIVRMLEYFTLLAGNHLFTPHKLVFGVFNPINEEHYQPDPQKAQATSC